MTTSVQPDLVSSNQQKQHRHLNQARRFLGRPPLHPVDPSSLTHSDEAEVLHAPISKDLIFICIDLEAFEFSRKKITEIGVSILDVRDIKSSFPTPDISLWLSHIHTRHFRIEEHAEYVNKVNVHGCPDSFDFGSSQWIHLNQIEALMKSIFCVLDKNRPDEFRNIILVGHDVKNDIGFFRSVGISVFSWDTVIATLDTQKMMPTQTGLCRTLLALGETPEHLHNAGNDAHYTMRAFLKMVARNTALTSADLDNVVLPPAEMEMQHKRRERDRNAKEKKAKKRMEREAAENEKQQKEGMDQADPAKSTKVQGGTIHGTHCDKDRFLTDP
ncbi:MAG: hypothetical protein M1822_008563 [Bathelium mastoideum]|nr:MAG: hypothetical protein M1822_008563 [Bathelium mastoideum]